MRCGSPDPRWARYASRRRPERDHADDERSDTSIETYREKRDFGKTPEPAPGDLRETPANPSFVIHRHEASHLHYDLRLEFEGVLKSFAVPKGFSYVPTDKHLAVRTEDHPMEYIDFHGVIPKGEYGAGTMKIWDRGTYTWNLAVERGTELPPAEAQKIFRELVQSQIDDATVDHKDPSKRITGGESRHIEELFTNILSSLPEADRGDFVEGARDAVRSRDVSSAADRATLQRLDGAFEQSARSAGVGLRRR